MIGCKTRHSNKIRRVPIELSTFACLLYLIRSPTPHNFSALLPAFRFNNADLNRAFDILITALRDS